MNSVIHEPNAPTLHIVEGYEVRDAANETLGSVKAFQFSDDNPQTPEIESIEPALASDQQGNLVTAVADVLADREAMPEEVRRMLLQKGYVRVATGIFHNDLFATMDQVSHVVEKIVYLNTTKDGLLAF